MEIRMRFGDADTLCAEKASDLKWSLHEVSHASAVSHTLTNARKLTFRGLTARQTSLYRLR